MGDYGINKNGEGYSDPTAFKAITNMAKPGEIWTSKRKDGVDGEVLVIKNLERFSVVLDLQDFPTKDRIEVISRSVKYTDPAMVRWMYNTALSGFVKKLPEKDFYEVVSEINTALNLELLSVEGTGTGAEEEALKKENVKLKQALDRYIAKERDSSEGTDIMKIQLQTYKTMYDELIQKILAKQVG